MRRLAFVTVFLALLALTFHALHLPIGSALRGGVHSDRVLGQIGIDDSTRPLLGRGLAESPPHSATPALPDGGVLARGMRAAECLVEMVRPSARGAVASAPIAAPVLLFLLALLAASPLRGQAEPAIPFSLAPRRRSFLRVYRC